MTPLSPPRRRLLAGLGLGLAGLVAAWPSARARAEPMYGQPPAEQVGGELDLTDQHGLPFSRARLSGRPGLVFFGATHCGSTCPVALISAREVLSRFDGRAAPAIVFVTLDPLSDGPRELREHLGRIDPRLIGLTGSPSRVARVAERYGVGTRVTASGIDHSAKWYLLDTQGQVRRIYSYSESPEHLAADLRRLESF